MTFYTADSLTDEEYRCRQRKVQQGLAAADIDALLLTDHWEFRYLTGFATRFWQSPTRPWFLLLPASGEPVAVIPGIGRECLARTGVADIRCWPTSGESATGGSEPCADPCTNATALLIDTLRTLFPRRARVGLMAGAECIIRMPYRELQTLQSRLSDVEFVDASAILQRIRQVKSAAEIDRIARVCEMVSGVFEALPATLRCGQTERAVFKRFKIACLEAGVDDIDYLVGGAGRHGYRDIISPPGDRRLERGDILMLDTGCVLDGYHCDFDRNIAIGTPAPAVADAHRILWDATEAALQFVRPGITASALFERMHSIIQSARPDDDASTVGRYGHGLGLQLTETPSLAPNDHTVLEAGMVITLEPSISLPGERMLVHEENLVITEHGARLLTRRAPAELPVCE